MNPEFRRQLWLQFSPTRLIVLPALLLLGALPILLSDDTGKMQSLAEFAGVAFMILVFGMGTRAAGASIVDEIREHTWDQQRMSAMQPWAMTWGKLLGATSYSWYGGALCALIYIPSAVAAKQPHVLLSVVIVVLAGLMLHALLVAINLQMSRFSGRLAQRGGIWALLVLVGWMVPMLLNLRGDENTVSWWSLSFTDLQMAGFSLMIFTGCALVTTWRCMAESLAVRQLPWGWPALALVLSGFFGGFGASQYQYTTLAGFIVSAVLTYAALVSEPHPRTVWQGLLARMGAGQWRRALQQLPRWPGTLLLTLVFAIVLLAYPLHDKEVAMNFIRYAPLAAALMLLRDCAIALFFSFNPRARRPLVAFMVAMLVLYGLLPWFEGTISWWSESESESDHFSLVLPLFQARWTEVGIAAIHAVAALALLRWRWVTTRSAND